MPDVGTPVPDTGEAMHSQFQLAIGLWNRGLYKMAAQEFHAFIEQHPQHHHSDRARYYRVRCFIQMEEYEEALSAISRIRESIPQFTFDARLTLLSGEIHLKTGNASMAVREFDKLRDHHQEEIAEAALYYQGRAYAAQGKRPHAASTYTRLAAKPLESNRPFRAYAAFELASIYREVNQIHNAEGQYQRLADKAEAPAELREESLYQLAMLFESQEHYKQAADRYAELQKQFPDGKLAKPALLREMRMRLFAGHPSSLEKLADKWHKQYGDEDMQQVSYLRGLAFQAIEQYEQALPFFRRAVDIDADNRYRELAHYQLCYSLLQTEKYSETERTCASFIDSYPDSPKIPDIHFFAAMATHNQQRFDKAADHLHLALQTIRESEEKEWQYQATALSLLAALEEKNGNFTAAAELYDKLTTRADGEKRLRYILSAAEMYIKEGEVKTAIKRFQQIINEADPASEEAAYAAITCARLLLARQELDEAENFLGEQLQNEQLQNHYQLRFLLGLTLFRKGRYADAHAIFTTLLEVAEKPFDLELNLRYLLAATLIEMDQIPEALKTFAPVLEEIDDRQPPAFDSEFLLNLSRLYADNNNHALSKKLSRQLINVENPNVAYQATLQLARHHIAANDLDQATQLLTNAIRKFPDRLGNVEPAPCPELFSLLGEAYMLQNRHDQAIMAFRQSLAKGSLPNEYLARSQWGIANILDAEDRYPEALRHAVNAFIMADDKLYTPKAMWLAVELLVKLERREEARTTWNELKTRFPAMASKHEGNEIIHLIDE